MAAKLRRSGDGALHNSYDLPMKINIIARSNHHFWGGDTRVLHDLLDGLRAIGVNGQLNSEEFVPKKDETYIISNTCLSQTATAKIFEKAQQSYFVMPFHEDFLKYYSASLGFPQVVFCAVKGQAYFGLEIDMFDLMTRPELAYYYPAQPLMVGLANSKVLTRAKCSFPSSEFERTTILRDAPSANCKSLLLPTAQPKLSQNVGAEVFAKKFGICAPYILQVGRIETRKNQLATVIAAKDIEVPLVFIATRGYNAAYEQLLINTIRLVRKHPTYIISQNLPDADYGLLKIRNMGNDEKLPWEVLESAYRGALVNCHPAFYELPGLTYLESIHLGVPTICSNDTSIKEYIPNWDHAEGLFFVDPTDLKALKDSLAKALYGPRATSAQLITMTEEQYARNMVDAIMEAQSRVPGTLGAD